MFLQVQADMTHEHRAVTWVAAQHSALAASRSRCRAWACACRFAHAWSASDLAREAASSACCRGELNSWLDSFHEAVKQRSRVQLLQLLGISTCLRFSSSLASFSSRTLMSSYYAYQRRSQM